MLDFLHSKRREQYLAAHPISDDLWQCVVNLPLLRGLNTDDLALLRQQAAWFLHRKAITSVAGLALDDRQGLLLAVQAVLPVLHLGFDCLDDWQELVVYPTAFRVRDLQREWLDGHLEVEFELDEALTGQARADGPVLLSWQDAEISPWLDGWNVVIHEIAHKLDMLDSDANGCPPLHAGMDFAVWKSVFAAAFADLNHHADTDDDHPFDLYAATDPAEFFAVCSEYFFELPHFLIAHYPAVYAQLQLFYRQDPASRLVPINYRPILPEMQEVYARELF